MARQFSNLFTFSLFIACIIATCLAYTEPEDDILIRQVVQWDTTVMDHFNAFKHKFSKSYASQEEHEYRFSVFKDNLDRAKRHQDLDSSAIHGVTQFSDMTPDEFSKHLGLRSRLKFPADAAKAPILPTDNLPEDFDWRDHGAVTGVKNQGSCGSCWSFSTTGALEGANFLATRKLESLSEQQLVDCDHECDPEEKGSCDAGCNGGLMTSAFEYTLKAGGLMREKDYPYTATDHGTRVPIKEVVYDTAPSTNYVVWMTSFDLGPLLHHQPP